MQILKFISKCLTKLILYDGNYFRKKLLHQPVVYGLENRVSVGKNSNLQNVILNTSSGKIVIGDYCFFGHDCMVLTGTHEVNEVDDARINNHPIEGRDIIIGRGVWVSSRAMVLGGVTIADNSVIAAGAVVTKDCLIPGIYAGVPAKMIAKISSYRSQKNETLSL